MAGRDQVDVGEAGQNLRHFLDHDAGQRRRAGGTGLAGGQKQDRHAGAHGGFQAAAGVLGELERRHHEAAGHADEGARPPGRLAAGHQMQHGDRLIDVLGQDEAGADVFCGPGDAGIAGVEIQVPRVGHVARDDRALEEMDVVQPVDQTRQIIEIGQGGFTVFAGVDVNHVHGRAGGAEMDLLAPGLQVVARVETVQHEVPAGLGQRVLDHGPREPQPAVVADAAAGPGHQLDARRDSVGEAEVRQQVQCRLVNPLHLGFAERLVAAASMPGRTANLVGGAARSSRRAVRPPRRRRLSCTCVISALRRSALARDLASCRRSITSA